MTLPDKKTAAKRIELAGKEVDVQFNLIRTQMRNIQQKHDVLKRLKANLKKHNETVIL